MPLILLHACLALAVASAALCALLMPLARRLALRLDLVDAPGERKIHVTPIPYGGGIAIVGSFAVVLVGAWVLAVHAPAMGVLAELRDELRQLTLGLSDPTVWKRLAAVLGGGGAMFALGLIDDKRGLGPKLKLALQIAAAVLLFLVDVRITIFVDHWAVSLLLTVVWVVGITNALNLLDNMDGLAGGVALIAAIIFFVVAVQSGQVFVAGLLAALVGSLIGFLFYNFNPASIFMGDAGALFLGYMLAAVSMAGTYYRGQGASLAVVMPLVVLAIPIFDTMSVMVIRLRAGAPLMVGDRNHFSHRLVRLGMTTREAVLTIYVLTATLGVNAVLLTSLDGWGAALVLLHTVGTLAVVALLENAAHRRTA